MCCENVFSVQVSTKEFFFTLAAIAAEVSELRSMQKWNKKTWNSENYEKTKKKTVVFFFRKVILLKLFLTLFAATGCNVGHLLLICLYNRRLHNCCNNQKQNHLK